MEQFEENLVYLQHKDLLGLYCINPHVYENTVNQYIEILRRREGIAPIEIFSAYLVDSRQQVFVINDGTHRSKACLNQRRGTEALLIQDPNKYVTYHLLKEIPTLAGRQNPRVLTDKKGRFF